jgi:hypothetical protein
VNIFCQLINPAIIKAAGLIKRDSVIFYGAAAPEKNTASLGAGGAIVHRQGFLTARICAGAEQINAAVMGSKSVQSLGYFWSLHLWSLQFKTLHFQPLQF